MPLDLTQILKDCFDPTKNALRIRVAGADAASAPGADPVKQIQACYDAANHALKATNVGAPSGASGTVQDWQHVIKAVFVASKSKINIVQ